ncbi:MAG: MMPL family transporter [Desulfobacterales bacterium]
MSNNSSLIHAKENVRTKALILIVSLIVIAASVTGIFFISFDNNMELMLPDNDEIQRSMRFLRESNFSDKIIISLGLNDSAYTETDLISEVDRFAQSLKPPLISDVMYRVSESETANEMFQFLKYIQQLTYEKTLEKIDSQLNDNGIKSILQKNYRQLLSPSSIFITPILRSDPLGIKTGLLSALQKLSSSTGYEVSIKNGHFISEDGKHALLILKTPVSVTDGFGSKNLISYLKKEMDALPKFINGDIIAGHLHTVSNENVIKRDIKIVSIIAAIAFFFIFFFFFRDIKAAYIFIIPLASVAVSINLSYFIMGNLSYFIMGMGAVIAGISIDYGIHIYIAVSTGSNRKEAVRNVTRPIVTGALTTMSVFAAFFFSDVRGFHQLAVFSILSIIFCLLCSLYILPVFIEGKTARAFPAFFDEISNVTESVSDKAKIYCWAILMIILLFLSSKAAFNSDIKQFDGSEPYIFKAEENFQRVWGEKDNPAILVVQEESLERALLINERIYRESVKRFGNEDISNFAAIWPSNQTRTENSARWIKFWKEREEKFKKLLAKHGASYNFSDDAFSPFFENLYGEMNTSGWSENNLFLKRIKERFVLESRNGYQVLTYFPDNDQYIGAFTEFCRNYPGSFIVSRKSLSKALSDSISSEIIYLSAIAAFFIPFFTLILLKNLRLAILALIPVFTGIIASLGILPVMGLTLNAPSIIAIMVVTGLCIDYGIFMAYTSRYHLKTGTAISVFLSAFTTLIGAGVLLFARHPVLFSIGVTLFSGVLAGYMASVAAVPSIYRLWFDKKGDVLT